jgi:hypothetical protein
MIIESSISIHHQEERDFQWQQPIIYEISDAMVKSPTLTMLKSILERESE